MNICMDPKVRYGNSNLAQKAIMRGPLTDKRLARYIKLGYYTPEAQLARREWRQKAKTRRRGDFVEMEDGRLVYSPL